jgi:hypothetical protein
VSSHSPSSSASMYSFQISFLSIMSNAKIMHKSLLPSRHSVLGVSVWFQFANITWIISLLVFCAKYKKLLARVILLHFKEKTAFLIHIQIGSSSS